MSNKNLRIIQLFNTFDNLQSKFNNISEQILLNKGIELEENHLLNIFCKSLEFENMDELKNIFLKSENIKKFENAKEFKDIIDIAEKEQNSSKILNDYFDSNENHIFKIIKSQKPNDTNNCFLVENSDVCLFFGETKNSGHLIKHINTDLKYFILKQKKNNSFSKYSTSNFEQFVYLIKKFIKTLGISHLDDINEEHFFQVVRSNEDITRIIYKKHLNTCNSCIEINRYFTQYEVETILNDNLKFTRKISDGLFSKIYDYFNLEPTYYVYGYSDSNDLNNRTKIGQPFIYMSEALSCLNNEVYTQYEALSIFEKSECLKFFVKSIDGFKEV